MADGKRVVHMRKALQYALDSSFKLTSDEILAHFQEIVADQTKRQALVTIANEVLGKVRSNVEVCTQSTMQICSLYDMFYGVIVRGHPSIF